MVRWVRIPSVIQAPDHPGVTGSRRWHCRASRSSRVTSHVCGHIPARSPDLTPVEQVWAHLRMKLRAMDLADAVAKKPVLGKTAYMMRVRQVVKSQRFQSMAGNVARGLRKTCREVVRKRGAAAGR